MGSVGDVECLWESSRNELFASLDADEVITHFES